MPVLSPATINRRVSSVIDFLLFAAATGRRQAFEVDYVMIRRSYQRSGQHHSSDPTKKRYGSVRQHPEALELPSLADTAAWLWQLKVKHGITPYYMAKTVIGLGLRREEIVLLRANQLPSIPVNDASTARMRICFGTKVGRDPNDPEKIGKARTVRVEIALLKDLHGYAVTHRKLCLRKFRELNPNEPEPAELFLSKYTGRRFTPGRFYQLWTSPTLPFPAFSPHIGRHMWACYTLLDAIRRHAKLSNNADTFQQGVLNNLDSGFIVTLIRTQLGHVDDRTTERYLSWIYEAISLPYYHETWLDFLERA